MKSPIIDHNGYKITGEFVLPDGNTIDMGYYDNMTVEEAMALGLKQVNGIPSLATPFCYEKEGRIGPFTYEIIFSAKLSIPSVGNRKAERKENVYYRVLIHEV